MDSGSQLDSNSFYVLNSLCKEKKLLHSLDGDMLEYNLLTRPTLSVTHWQKQNQFLKKRPYELRKLGVQIGRADALHSLLKGI